MRVPIAPHPPADTRRLSLKRIARSALVAGPGVLLIGALTWPMLFSNSSFGGMWMLELVYMWKQSITIGAGHLPTLFLNYSRGVFYPWYAFFAGTLYTFAGLLSLIVGGTPFRAYLITYLLGFAAAYGGWYWIARQAGLGRWQAQIPGVVFITSACYLTMIYAEGEWSEFIGVSLIPVMIASGISVLRANRLRLWPALALVISCTLFAGSHVLTVVWGSTAIIILCLAIAIWVAPARREVSRSGLMRLIGLAVPALLVTAWFLVPAAAYQSTTWIAGEYPTWRNLLKSTTYLVSMQHLFTLSRASAAHDEGFALSLPILVMAWALVGLGLAAFAGPRGPWTRILLICAGFTALVIVLMTHAGLILALPRYYATLQYSYRLENYVVLGLSGAVLSVLVIAKSGNRHLRSWTRWALLPSLVVAMIGAIQQVEAHPSDGDRNAELAAWPSALAPSAGPSYETSSAEAVSSEGVVMDYVDVQQPVLSGPLVRQPQLAGLDIHPPVLQGRLERLPLVHFATTTEQGAPISATIKLHPGERLNSNLYGSSNFVHITGARIIGISGGSGTDVLEADPASASPEGQQAASTVTGTITVVPSSSFPIVLGRVLTVCALIALALQFGLLAVRRVLGDRGPGAIAPSRPTRFDGRHRAGDTEAPKRSGGARISGMLRSKRSR
jgi:hypothetical protein